MPCSRSAAWRSRWVLWPALAERQVGCSFMARVSTGGLQFNRNRSRQVAESAVEGHVKDRMTYT